MKKRLLSVLLAMSLCFSLLPTTVWAEEDEDSLLGDPEKGPKSEVSLTVKKDGTPYYYDSFISALYDANEFENATITLLCNVPANEILVDFPLTIDMDFNKITGDLEVTDNLTLINGTIEGELTISDGGVCNITGPINTTPIDGKLTVSDGSVTISGTSIGVTGALEIGKDASVTISASKQAVKLSSAPNVTLYGSTKENGNTAVEAIFDPNLETYKVNGKVAKTLSTQKVDGTTEPEEPTPGVKPEPVIDPQRYVDNCFFTGEPMANPVPGTDLLITLGSASDITGYQWYQATKNDNDYTKGNALSSAPVDGGDYYLEVDFQEGETTKAATIGFGLTVKPKQQEEAITTSAFNIRAGYAHTYEIDVAKEYLSQLRLGSNVTYELKSVGSADDIFVGGSSAIKLDGTTLILPVASYTRQDLPAHIMDIRISVHSSNYNQITLTIPLTLVGRKTITFPVNMPSWTYGEAAVEPQFTLPEEIKGVTPTISYTTPDGAPLNKKFGSVDKYRVTVTYSTADTIYSGTALFEITPAPITADMVALEQNQLTFLPNADYSSGVEQTQGVTVTWKDQPLADANYTLTGNTATDAGTYTLTVAGTGNFTGTVEKTWTVAPLPVGFDLDGDIRKDYDGTDAADVSISDWHVEGSSAPTTFQLPDNLYTVTGAAYDSAEAGEGKTVQFTVTLNENYAFSDGSRSKAFSSADFPGVTAAINKEQKPVNPYNPGSVWLQAGLDQMGYLTLDYFRKINANLPADAEITAVQLNEGSVSGVIDHLSVLDGMVSYDIAHNAPAGSKVNCTVTISSRNCDYLYTVSFYPEEQLVPRGRPTLSRDTLTYGEKLGDITISGNLWDSEKNPIDGRFSWDYPEATPEVGSYTTNWTFTSYDDAYLPFIDGTVTITVNKITLDSTPKFTLISTSGKTLADAGLAAASAWPEGTLTWDLPLETTVAANTAYGWTFTPADTAHYETATGTIVLYPVSGGGGSGGGGGGGRPSTPAAPSTPTTPTTPDVPSTPEQPFTDVAPEDWFYDAVTWAKGAGITGGVSQDRFGSGAPCTRGQIVTFLWRAAGSPAPKGQVSMTDVPADAYYSTAVAWAVENGIASGTGANLFSPDAPCTRAQAVTFLWRAAGSPAAQGGADFHDVTDGDYFAQAVAWANEHDITDGVGGGLFGSMDSCTRSQIVTFLFMAR